MTTRAVRVVHREHKALQVHFTSCHFYFYLFLVLEILIIQSREVVRVL